MNESRSDELRMFIEDLYASYGDPQRFDAHLDPAITIWESDCDDLLVGVEALDTLRNGRPGETPKPKPATPVRPVPRGFVVDAYDEFGIVRYDLGVEQGRGGRLTVAPDLTVPGHERVYAVGDIANIPAPDGHTLPQLGSVALQAGRWAAANIVADHAGTARTPFHYKDKGIMAMIGATSPRSQAPNSPSPPHAVPCVACIAWTSMTT